MGFGFNKRPVMIMEMHVNISGPTKVDVGGNDS
ncbi:BnaC01g30290D [Brassica napus]|uniref:BnaC01g30290D protein n=1 Tax=Brassica napus TaxID=3708 RepID=A0A078I8Y1_BRANA|nr:BnaC01g30290D [Brassica napus]